jgi:uncharacterized membrane-anchored protein
MSKPTPRPEAALEAAQFQVVEAKKRLAASKGALQYRLKPANLAAEAWEGVREKGEAAADGALGAVKGRPGAVGGVLAAATLFLAREPIWRAVSGIFGRGRAEDPNIVKADLDQADGSFDLTAPTVERSRLEGVNA